MEGAEGCVYFPQTKVWERGPEVWVRLGDLLEVILVEAQPENCYVDFGIEFDLKFELKFHPNISEKPQAAMHMWSKIKKRTFVSLTGSPSAKFE